MKKRRNNTDTSPCSQSLGAVFLLRGVA